MNALRNVKMLLEVIDSICLMCLIVISAIVFNGLINNENMWKYIQFYWEILLVKNVTLLMIKSINYKVERK